REATHAVATLQDKAGCGGRGRDVEVDALRKLGGDRHRVAGAEIDAARGVLDRERRALHGGKPEAIGEDEGRRCLDNGGGRHRRVGAGIAEALVLDLRTLCNGRGCDADSACRRSERGVCQGCVDGSAGNAAVEDAVAGTGGEDAAASRRPGERDAWAEVVTVFGDDGGCTGDG